MDYPTKFHTCDLCGGRYADSDGGCACCDDRSYCSACQTYYPEEAPTHLRRERLGDGTVTARTVCADCARCQGCEQAVGTMLNEHGDWLCAACAAEEL